MSPQFRAATVQPWQAQRGQDHPRVLLWGGGTRKAQGLLLQGEMEPWACGLPEHSAVPPLPVCSHVCLTPVSSCAMLECYLLGGFYCAARPHPCVGR